MMSVALELEPRARREEAPPSSLNVVLELLVDATRRLGEDHKPARDHISQARDLLRGALLAPPASGGLAPWQVKRVADFVDAHLHEKIRTIDLARVARLSDRYFSEAFKVNFGERPQAYVTRRRLERAQAMMVESGDPLCQIALACGMADQSHLSRLFRIHLGRSPNHWRREQVWLRTVADEPPARPA